MRVRYSSRAARVAAFSLVELAIVLAVIGIIIGGVLAASAMVWEYEKREQAIEEIGETVANARGFFAGQAGVPNIGYPTLSSNLIAANVIPNSARRTASGTCTNPAGLCADAPWGPLTSGGITPVGVVDGAGTFRVCNWSLGLFGCPAAPAAPSPFFSINLTGLTQKSCIALVEAISGSRGPSGLVEININSYNVLASGNSIQPVTAGVATTHCAPGFTPFVPVNFVYRYAAPTL
jgi:type II secretory pathway pseudopilin PulG